MVKISKQKLFIEAVPLLGDNPSGVAKLLYSIIDSLSRQDDFCSKYEIILVIPLGKRAKLVKWNLSSNIKVRVIPLPLRLINVLDRFNLLPGIDMYLGRGVYLFPNYRRLPLLHSNSLTYIHDAAYHIHPETVLAINRIFLERIVPRAVRKSDLIITLSEQSKRELKKIFPENEQKIHVVPCGIDQRLYAYSGDMSETSTVLRRAGVVSGKYIIFVGNIEPRKNINYLIDVYISLVDTKKVSSDMTLLLIGGGGWNNEALFQRIAQLNKSGYSIIRPAVRIEDEDLPTLYHESYLATLLSVHEGFGMTPLEALSAGARVVVSDIPVLREVGGDVVSYAPLSDILGAATQFTDAASKPIDDAAIRARLDGFSWDTAARDLIDLIEDFDKDRYNRER